MAGKIYTMLGGHSLPFEPEAIEALTTFTRSYTKENPTKQQVEVQIADILLQKNHTISVDDVHKAIARTQGGAQESQHSELNKVLTNPELDRVTQAFAKDEPMITGAALYFAKKINKDVLSVRLALIFLIFFQGIGVLLYGIAYMYMRYDQSSPK